ncbi:hypothetical protein [Streptomyces antibioticus]|uniref:hypothetical protein n=1 Tax=Streptomyces antibioticus TaxID=1890 RepID=UPI00224D1EED|nr:hypothetical protein [Streptomyces antibioticus]MCX4742677.1 hypothetical protein [Streptomyces antibioticus]
MTELDERSWAEAIEMYERRHTIAKVTARKHEDWALDVYTLMRGDTADARGWRVNDPYAGEPERHDNPFHPFTVLPSGPAKADEFRLRVFEISRPSARRLLVALSTPWLDVERVVDFEESRVGLEEKADIVLSRFPEGSRFYANTGRNSADLDYYKRIASCTEVSVYTWDPGLVLVSETEVGMVWSFIAW